MPENTDLTSLLKALKQTEAAVTQVTQVTQVTKITETDCCTSVDENGESSDNSQKEEQIEKQDHEAIQDGYLESLNLKILSVIRCLDDIETNVSQLKAANNVIQAEADGKVTDNKLRKDMADKTFGFMEKWCAFVGLIVFIYFAKKDGEPPTEFMLALLGTCTVSIIGLVGFVVSGLFKSPSRTSNDTDKK